MSSTTNSGQKLIRLIGLAVLVLMGIFPPWKLSYTVDGKRESVSAGYHFVRQPPPGETNLPANASDAGYVIDATRLSIQFVAALVLINIGYYALRTKKE